MKDTQNFHGLVAHAIRNDAGSAGDDEFAGSWNPAGTAHGRMPGKVGDGLLNAVEDAVCCLGIIERSIESASALRFAKSAESHLTCTARPLAEGLLHFCVGGELSTVGFGNPVTNPFNLPVIERDVVTYGLGDEERAGALGGIGEVVELPGQLGARRRVTILD